MPPAHYPPADHVQEVAKVYYDDALAAGIAAAALTLLPCGIHPERFDADRRKDDLRREHWIAPDTFLILSVAALNRNHKRTHHLIDEAARLRGFRVPNDLSVIGFDDLPEARWSSPPLTTVRQPLADMGGLAARTVLRLSRGEPIETPRVELATELVVRESTALFAETGGKTAQ